MRTLMDVRRIQRRADLTGEHQWPVDAIHPANRLSTAGLPTSSPRRRLGPDGRHWSPAMAIVGRQPHPARTLPSCTSCRRAVPAPNHACGQATGLRAGPRV